MIPAAFEYVVPSSVEEAVAALAQAGDREVKVLAGGQSLIPVLRLRLSAPDVLVDLRKLDDLRGISDGGDHLVIGAMTTHGEVAKDPLVKEHAALLAMAAQTVADEQVRHRGTLGGALAHADPAGDLGAPILALDATMVIAGPGGTREVAAAEFFTDVFTTAVGADDLLVQIKVPKHTGWGACYEKFNRTAQAWSIVAVAATCKVDGGTVSAAKIGLTNMGLVPVRASAAEAAMAGAAASAEAATTAAASAADGTSPLEDSNADAQYRTHLAKVLTGRALSCAVGASTC